MCSPQKVFLIVFVLTALLMGKSNRQAAADKHLDMCLKMNMNIAYRQQWLHFNCASVCGILLTPPCVQLRTQLITWGNDKAMMKFGYFIAKMQSSRPEVALLSVSLSPTACGLQQFFCLIVQHNEPEVNRCSCSQLSSMSSQTSTRFCHDTTHKSHWRNGRLVGGSLALS